MRKIYLSALVCLWCAIGAKAQIEEAIPSSSVNYKVLYDDPKDLNQLWIHVQPVTVDAGQMNSMIGSGLELNYMPIPRLDFRLGLRGNFFDNMDLQRAAAIRNAGITTQESKREEGRMVLTNSFSRFYNAEIGASYTFKDVERKSTAKVILLESAVPGHTAMPEVIEIDCKARHVWAARLGMQYNTSTVSLERAVDQQDVSIKGDKGTLISKGGTSTVNGFKTSGNRNELFSSFMAAGVQAGASFQVIKNMSLKTEKQGVISNNSILTVYADVLFSPITQLDNISARKVGSGATEVFDTNPIKINSLGGRVGVDMRFNQNAFLSYGAEVGYRPSIQGQGMYLVAKLGIPVFSFGSSQPKVANNVGPNQSLTQ